MKTCHHCGYEWTPRKAEPRKCPQCQNSLWRSPRPKKNRPEKTGSGGIETQRTAVVDKLYASSPTLQESNPASPALNLEGTQPIEKDTLSEAKAKAEALLRKLA